MQNGTSVALSKTLGLEGSFSDALTASLLNTLAASSFDTAGRLNLAEGSAGKIAVHATIGGLLAEVSGSDFLSGAVAAGANEALATQLRRKVTQLAPEQRDLLLTSASEVLGLIAAAAVGGDAKAVETGAWITKNATQYNFLNHYEMEDFVGDMEACGDKACYQNTWKGQFGNIDYDQLSKDNVVDAVGTVGPARAKDLLGQIHGGLVALGNWDCPPEACDYKFALIDRAFAAKAELQQIYVEGQGIVAGLLAAPVGAMSAGIRSAGAGAVIEARGVEKAYAYWIEAQGAKRALIPKGFSSADEFVRFGTNTRDGLARAGYGDVEPILQGSAVTGKSFKTGQEFDVGRVSDFDVALASPELLQRAQSLGIGLRSGGTRTGPLSARDLQALGLRKLRSSLHTPSSLC